MKTLLSICIPTYNRADLLRGCLECLAAEITPFGDEVELIVSDNCSTDHTREVVEEASKKVKIRYNRNESNLGFAGNIKILVEQLATGEFCWLIGDDDIARKGAISKILNIIKAHPEFDYIFMNISFERKRNKIKQIFEHETMSEPLYCSVEDCILDKWEDVIGMAKQSYYFPFTHLPCHIFRRSIWRPIADHNHRLSVEEVYPFIVALASAVVGKPCYYAGHPHVGMLFGTQEWADLHLAKIELIDTMEVTNLLEKLGVAKRLVDKYRNAIFRNAQFWSLITKQKPGRDSFSLKSMLSRYGMYPEFWKMIFVYPVTDRIRFYYRGLRGLFSSSKR